MSLGEKFNNNPMPYIAVGAILGAALIGGLFLLLVWAFA